PIVVTVDVEFRLTNLAHYLKWRDALEGATLPPKATREQVISTISAAAVPSSIEARILDELLPATGAQAEMLEALALANRILISDHGTGMDAHDLDEYFLTIGTPHRLRDLEKGTATGNGPIPTGEKGIGRLSMMRLGERVVIRTHKVGAQVQQELRI